MSILIVTILSFVQALAELLPVSSSAHVILVEKLLGLDPTSPELVFLLVMLHTGTMFSVLYVFKKRWIELLIDRTNRVFFIKNIFIATLMTGVVGISLKWCIEKNMESGSHFEIENLFGNLKLISAALFSAGLIILGTQWLKLKQKTKKQIQVMDAFWIGCVQGICLPFRGFSRSGVTISTGMYLSIDRQLVESFSFALAVVLTPAVILRSLLKLIKAHEVTQTLSIQSFLPGIYGMIISAIVGVFALKWLSIWMEQGKWHWFGYYCLILASLIFYFS